MSEASPDRAISARELVAYVDLVTAFHRRNGRDATDDETNHLVATARDIAGKRGTLQ